MLNLDLSPELLYIAAAVTTILIGLGIFVRRHELDELRTQRAMDLAVAEKEKAQIYLKFGEYMSRHETMSLLNSLQSEMHGIQNDIKEILIRLPGQRG